MNVYAKKSANILVLIFMMTTIFLFVYLRIEVWAKQTHAEAQLYASDAAWESFQYQQALRGVVPQYRKK